MHKMLHHIYITLRLLKVTSSSNLGEILRANWSSSSIVYLLRIPSFKLSVIMCFQKIILFSHVLYSSSCIGGAHICKLSSLKDHVNCRKCGQLWYSFNRCKCFVEINIGENVCFLHSSCKLKLGKGAGKINVFFMVFYHTHKLSFWVPILAAKGSLLGPYFI